MRRLENTPDSRFAADEKLHAVRLTSSVHLTVQMMIMKAHKVAVVVVVAGGLYNKYLLGRHNLRVRANQIFLLQL